MILLQGLLVVVVLFTNSGHSEEPSEKDHRQCTKLAVKPLYWEKKWEIIAVMVLDSLHAPNLTTGPSFKIFNFLNSNVSKVGRIYAQYYNESMNSKIEISMWYDMMTMITWSYLKTKVLTSISKSIRPSPFFSFHTYPHPITALISLPVSLRNLFPSLPFPSYHAPSFPISLTRSQSCCPRHYTPKRFLLQCFLPQFVPNRYLFAPLKLPIVGYPLSSLPRLVVFTHDHVPSN